MVVKDLSSTFLTDRGKTSSDIDRLEISVTYFLYKRLWNIEEVFVLEPTLQQTLLVCKPGMMEEELCVEEDGVWKKYDAGVAGNYLCLYEGKDRSSPANCFHLKNSAVLREGEMNILLVSFWGES